MKVELIVGIIGIVIAIFAVGVAGNTALNKTFGHAHPEVLATADELKTVEEAIMHQGEKIDTERLNNIAMAVIINDLEESDASQRIDIAILKARGDLTTQPNTNPTPVSSIDLRLKISDNKGNTKSGYPRDVPAILIQGESSMFKKSFLITIKDPNGAFVKDKFGETLSDGDISEAWIPVGNAIAGTYTVTIKMDLKTDSIQFDLL
jgi:hypothetical protein